MDAKKEVKETSPKAVKKEVEKAEVNKEDVDDERSEVRFSINSYDDLFSDFDPRPISLRGLSEDFLSEARRAMIEKDGKIDFIFLIPKKERNESKEEKIKDRLTKYFKKHAELLHIAKKHVIRFGAIFSAIGILLMFTATYIYFKTNNNENLLTSFLTVLLEPAGWFLFWEGLDQIIFESKKSDPNLEFNKKMAEAKIEFSSLEDLK